MGTKVWTYTEAVDFGKVSAYTALDAVGDYGSLEDAVESHRQNIRDTLAEYKASVYEIDAFAIFDAIIAGAY